MTTTYHIPVLASASVGYLLTDPTGVYVDVTFGGGGHSRLLLNALSPQGRLLAFDQDPDAIPNIPTDERFTLIRNNFRHLQAELVAHGYPQVTGILADLGVSSHQIDTPERGFSFRFDGPLDMRMNPEKGISAAELLNNSPQDAIADALYQYGELHNSRQLAAALVAARPLFTTTELRAALARFAPPHKQHKLLAQVFQALRIVVNDEMAVLEDFLEQALAVLAPGGRLVVISYHSLEDRRVKHFLKTGNLKGELIKDFYGKQITPWRLLTNKAMQAEEGEVDENPRARSARLRAAEKLAITQNLPATQ